MRCDVSTAGMHAYSCMLTRIRPTKIVKQPTRTASHCQGVHGVKGCLCVCVCVGVWGGVHGVGRREGRRVGREDSRDREAGCYLCIVLHRGRSQDQREVCRGRQRRE